MRNVIAWATVFFLLGMALKATYDSGVRYGESVAVFRSDPVIARRVVEAVLNEAEDQGREGMVAVAWTFRNRKEKNMGLGSSGLDSERVRARLALTPMDIRRQAERAVLDVWSDRVPDPTNGATYCENVSAFGPPNWIGDVEKTLQVNGLIFFREKGSGNPR